MRTILLASAAILAFGTVGTMTTTANAGSATWLAKKLLWECKMSHGVDQANCSKNEIKYGSKNYQYNTQDNERILFHPWDEKNVDQRNTGVNVVVGGSHNSQTSDQSNFFFGTTYHGDVDQKNTSVNTVQHGSGNTQENTQSNVAVGVVVTDLEQRNTATNTVENGYGNTQGADQSNTTVILGF